MSDNKIIGFKILNVQNILVQDCLSKFIFAKGNRLDYLVEFIYSNFNVIDNHQVPKVVTKKQLWALRVDTSSKTYFYYLNIFPKLTVKVKSEFLDDNQVELIINRNEKDPLLKWVDFSKVWMNSNYDLLSRECNFNHKVESPYLIKCRYNRLHCISPYYIVDYGKSVGCLDYFIRKFKLTGKWPILCGANVFVIYENNNVYQIAKSNDEVWYFLLLENDHLFQIEFNEKWSFLLKHVKKQKLYFCNCLGKMKYSGLPLLLNLKQPNGYSLDQVWSMFINNDPRLLDLGWQSNLSFTQNVILLHHSDYVLLPDPISMQDYNSGFTSGFLTAANDVDNLTHNFELGLILDNDEEVDEKEIISDMHYEIKEYLNLLNISSEVSNYKPKNRKKDQVNKPMIITKPFHTERSDFVKLAVDRKLARREFKGLEFVPRTDKDMLYDEMLDEKDILDEKEQTMEFEGEVFRIKLIDRIVGDACCISIDNNVLGNLAGYINYWQGLKIPVDKYDCLLRSIDYAFSYLNVLPVSEMTCISVDVAYKLCHEVFRSAFWESCKIEKKFWESDVVITGYNKTPDDLYNDEVFEFTVQTSRENVIRTKGYGTNTKYSDLNLPVNIVALLIKEHNNSEILNYALKVNQYADTRFLNNVCNNIRNIRKMYKFPLHLQIINNNENWQTKTGIQITKTADLMHNVLYEDKVDYDVDYLCFNSISNTDAIIRSIKKLEGRGLGRYIYSKYGNHRWERVGNKIDYNLFIYMFENNDFNYFKFILRGF